MEGLVRHDYYRVFATGQTLLRGGPIKFFVQGPDEFYLDLNNSKLKIKLKIKLVNGNDLTGGDIVGPLNDIFNAFFISMEMELAGVLYHRPEYKIFISSCHPKFNQL